MIARLTAVARMIAAVARYKMALEAIVELPESYEGAAKMRVIAAIALSGADA